VPRVVVLGCGTGVGKTHFGVSLLRALAARGASTIGLKPIESGMAPGAESPLGSDASALAAAGTVHSAPSRPIYALGAAVSPHLAARIEGIRIEEQLAARWVRDAEAVASDIWPSMAIWSLVETAGGVFSPLSRTATNFDLALALDPAIWVLVAADALGVLHDVNAALLAMQARNRVPDHVVLSAARPPDASTGTNAAELVALGIVTPSAVLARDDHRGLDALVASLLSPGDQP